MEETILQSIERKEVYYKTMITTHEVTIGQQTIQIKKLKEQLDNAQMIVTDGINTILRLQGELRVSDAEVDSLLEQNEILYGTIDVSGERLDTCPCCNNDVFFDGELRHVLSDTTASGRGMIQYPFNPEGKPEPYPYTHPIRDIPDYSKVKVK